MSDFYILAGHSPIETDVITWGEWFHDADNRRVASAEWRDPIGGRTIQVSTVFLGLDHAFGGGPPLLFETMIFAPDLPIDEEQYRFGTWDEALHRHRAIVAELAGVYGPPQESAEAT